MLCEGYKDMMAHNFHQIHVTSRFKCKHCLLHPLPSEIISVTDKAPSWYHIPVHAIMFPTGSVPTNGAQMFWATEWVIRWVWWWCWCVFWLCTSCWITQDTAVANAKWAETLATSHCCNFKYQMHELCNGNVSNAHYQISWEVNHK